MWASGSRPGNTSYNVWVLQMSRVGVPLGSTQPGCPWSWSLQGVGAAASPPALGSGTRDIQVPSALPVRVPPPARTPFSYSGFNSLVLWDYSEVEPEERVKEAQPKPSHTAKSHAGF